MGKKRDVSLSKIISVLLRFCNRKPLRGKAVETACEIEFEPAEVLEKDKEEEDDGDIRSRRNNVERSSSLS